MPTGVGTPNLGVCMIIVRLNVDSTPRKNEKCIHVWYPAGLEFLARRKI